MVFSEKETTTGQSVPSIVIILGSFRSGTSLTAALCHRMGVYFGPGKDFSPAADRFNPSGYFQRVDIVRANELMVESSADGFNRSMPLTVMPTEALTRRLEMLDMDWAKDHAAVGLKDPRFSLTLPLWLSHAPWGDRVVRLIWVRRNLDAAARSAIRHRFVGEFCNYDFDLARALTERLDKAAGELCRMLPHPSHVVDYDCLLENPIEETETLAGFLECDRSRAPRVAGLVGKKASMIRHYGRKLLQPKQVIDATGKTIRVAFRSTRVGSEPK